MNHSNENLERGCLTVAVLSIVQIATFIVPCYWAWTWVKPETFAGFFLFLIVWGFTSYAFSFLLEIAMTIIVMIFENITK